MSESIKGFKRLQIEIDPEYSLQTQIMVFNDIPEKLFVKTSGTTSAYLLDPDEATRYGLGLEFESIERSENRTEHTIEVSVKPGLYYLLVENNTDHPVTASLDGEWGNDE